MKMPLAALHELLGANLSAANLSKAKNLTQTQLDEACGQRKHKVARGPHNKALLDRLNVHFFATG